MQPQLGWVLFSRDAINRAEMQLRDDQLGVRDEIGFLLLHSGYANRFFPGTSVLQTRLRYALFIPWMYQDLLAIEDRKDVRKKVSEFETKLTVRLLHLDGAIGKRNFPDPISQPPSFIYWTALGTWGILKPRPDGSLPARSQLHRVISNQRNRIQFRDDDGKLLEEFSEYFINTPIAPKEWHNPNIRMSFQMTPEERHFMKRQLIGVMKPGTPPSPSFLSILAKNIADLDFPDTLNPWSRDIRQYADDSDKVALQQARFAAAISSNSQYPNTGDPVIAGP
jgi:hypothetical protein